MFMEINVCFSKKMRFYLLENKEGGTVLSKMKSFFLLLLDPLRYYKPTIDQSSSSSQLHHIQKIKKLIILGVIPSVLSQAVRWSIRDNDILLVFLIYF